MPDMTPDDLIATRRLWHPSTEEGRTIFALADALEQSWRDRDTEKREYAKAWASEVAKVNEVRAEAAAATRESIEVAQLIRQLTKAEAALANVQENLRYTHDQRNELQAALARVRALDTYGDEALGDVVKLTDIRAALGDTDA